MCKNLYQYLLIAYQGIQYYLMNNNEKKKKLNYKTLIYLVFYFINFKNVGQGCFLCLLNNHRYKLSVWKCQHFAI